jgi:uncharacterized protein YdiU (UPF0061 family)
MSKKYHKPLKQILPLTARKTNPAITRGKPETYELFDKIDGRHPWQSAVPTGFVPYQVRKLERGKVSYFNFALAREMGLISAHHPDELTPALVDKILQTFSIQIINEYDQSSGFRPSKESLKEHPHMATRYLQLQHVNKRGATSGDGRSIWNGIVRHKGITWDISSRGTGVTCLAPGAVEAEKPLKTGEGEFGYGCGLADLTELLGSAVMSEIFHLNGIQTERVLTVIDLGKGCGIGVRAAANLVRPAHLFLYLKQGRLDALKQATDYLIQRQIDNGEWNFPQTPSANLYQLMLSEISTSFARFAARLERNYIFAWLDWDGDNVLASAGIIDYGSIRQFGLRHDQYRYDDVERFSTNLNEQRGKARATVQTFAQLVNFLETGKRRAIDHFENHPVVRQFDHEFDLELRRVFLSQVGFDQEQAQMLLKTRSADVEKLYSSFLQLEKTKTRAGLQKLPDGFNRPAVFNMRRVLREMPNRVLLSIREKDLKSAFSPENLIEIMTTSFAKRADLRLRGGLRERIEKFIKDYLRLLHLVSPGELRAPFLKAISVRAEEKNRAGRITGNGAEFIVEAIVKAKRRGLSFADIQTGIDLFISSQAPKAQLGSRRARATSLQSAAGQLFQELVHVAHDFEEDI